MEGATRYRVIVAKPGLDGHDRGARIVARTLRDAGFEVIYLGLFQTIETITNVAVDEDVDAVGLSVLSGAHRSLFVDLVASLDAAGRSDVLVFGGGVIPQPDVDWLEQAGVAKLFTPGSSLQLITDWLRRALDQRELSA